MRIARMVTEPDVGGIVHIKMKAMTISSALKRKAVLHFSEVRKQNIQNTSCITYANRNCKERITTRLMWIISNVEGLQKENNHRSTFASLIQGNA